MRRGSGDDELLEEQRRGYDRQVEKIEAIDRKIARTVRIAAVIVGFVVTGAVTVGTIPPGPTVLGALGVFFLLTAVAYGLFSFGETRYKLRLAPGEYTDVQLEYDQGLGDEAPIRRKYRDWTGTLNTQIDRASRRLGAVQVALLVGVTYLAASGLTLAGPPLVVFRLLVFLDAVGLPGMLAKLFAWGTTTVLVPVGILSVVAVASRGIVWVRTSDTRDRLRALVGWNE